MGNDNYDTISGIRVKGQKKGKWRKCKGCGGKYYEIGKGWLCLRCRSKRQGGIRKMELSGEEKEMIRKSLIEYEENHYETENDEWQRKINKLIERFG